MYRTQTVNTINDNCVVVAVANLDKCGGGSLEVRSEMKDSGGSYPGVCFTFRNMSAEALLEAAQLADRMIGSTVFGWLVVKQKTIETMKLFGDTYHEPKSMHPAVCPGCVADPAKYGKQIAL